MITVEYIKGNKKGIRARMDVRTFISLRRKEMVKRIWLKPGESLDESQDEKPVENKEPAKKISPNSLKNLKKSAKKLSNGLN